MQNYEFDVELRNIQVCAGKKIPDRKAVVRKDNGLVLGIVGNDYKPVLHSRVIDTFESVPFLKRNRIDVCQEGRIMFAQYDIKTNGDIKKAEVQKGDIVSFGLRGFNSFDTSYGVGFELNANRLVCTNGLVIPKTVARLSFRHFQNVDIPGLARTIQARMEQLNPTVETWKRWLTIHPSKERIQEYLKKVKIGKRIEEELLEKAVIDSTDTGVWGVYQVLTAYVSHGLKLRGKEENRMLAVRNKERELLHGFYKFNWN